MSLQDRESEVAGTVVDRPVRSTTTPAPATRSRGVRRGLRTAGLEGLLLAAGPLLAFFVLRIRAMAVFNVIDEGIYSGLVQSGPDLMTRLGPGKYYWVRLGFTAPARVFELAMGPVGGFYAFRYVLALLATVLPYLLLRRLYGRAAGAVAVAVVLTSPVVWTAWGSDYPDSAAFSYLLGGAALLVMPAGTRARRRAVVGTAGLLLALAVHCQAVAALLVAPMVLGWLLAYGRPGRVGRLLGEVLVLAVGALAATVALVVVAQIWLGHWDIFTPTYDAYRFLQRPDQKTLWHTADWHWGMHVPYVVVPAVAAAAWVLTAVLDRARTSRAEVALCLGALLQIAVAAYEQFLAATAMLEYRLYSSMLWPAVLMLTALVLVHLGRSAQSAARPRRRLLAIGVRAAPAGLVVAVAVAWSLVRPAVDLHHFRVVVLVAVVAVAAAGAAERLSGAVTWLAAAGMVGALTVLTTAIALPAPGSPTLVPPAHGEYGLVLGDHVWSSVDDYSVAAEAQALVPAATALRQLPVTWWSDGAPSDVLQVAGRFQFFHLAPGLPTPAVVRQTAHDLARLAPDPLIMMGSDDADFAPFLSAFRAYGTRATVLRKATLVRGNVRMAVWIVRFDAFGDPCPGPGVVACPPLPGSA